MGRFAEIARKSHFYGIDMACPWADASFVTLTYRGIALDHPRHVNCRCNTTEAQTMRLEEYVKQLQASEHRLMPKSPGSAPMTFETYGPTCSKTNSTQRPEAQKPHQVTEAMRVEANRLLAESDYHSALGSTLQDQGRALASLSVKSFDRASKLYREAHAILLGKPADY